MAALGEVEVREWFVENILPLYQQEVDIWDRREARTQLGLPRLSEPQILKMREIDDTITLLFSKKGLPVSLPAEVQVRFQRLAHTDDLHAFSTPTLRVERDYFESIIPIYQPGEEMLVNAQGRLTALQAEVMRRAPA